MVRQLAGPVDERFDGVSAAVGEHDDVTLTDGPARFVTTIYEEVLAGDHTIVLLRAARGGAG